MNCVTINIDEKGIFLYGFRFTFGILHFLNFKIIIAVNLVRIYYPSGTFKEGFIYPVSGFTKQYFNQANTKLLLTEVQCVIDPVPLYHICGLT